MIDIPSQIDVATAVTGKKKVTLFGYSQGTAASMYGLVKNRPFYETHVDRAIMMAFCVVPPTKGKTYEDSVAEYGYFAKQGSIILNMLSDTDVQFNDGNAPAERLSTVKTLLHMTQISHAGQFQEPIPFADYVKGTRTSALVDLGKIDYLPVTVMIGSDDDTCFPAAAKSAFDLIGTSNKWFYEDAGLNHYSYTGPMDTAAMLNVIETGNREGDSALGFGLIGLLAATSALF